MSLDITFLVFKFKLVPPCSTLSRRMWSYSAFRIEKLQSQVMYLILKCGKERGRGCRVTKVGGVWRARIDQGTRGRASPFQLHQCRVFQQRVRSGPRTSAPRRSCLLDIFLCDTFVYSSVFVSEHVALELRLRKAPWCSRKTVYGASVQ